MTEPQPTPPEDVRIVLADGTEIPCDVKYAGIEDGIHMWDVVTEASMRPDQGDSFAIGMLPAHTGIQMPAVFHPRGRE